MQSATHTVDPSVMAAVAAGDRMAFALVYETFVPRVLGLVTRVVRDRSQSEEVAQEVFLEIWQKAAQFDPWRGNASSWVGTMAHRRAVDRVRAAQASRTRDLTVGIRDYPSAFDLVAEAGERAVDAVRVRAAMSALTKLQRQAVSLAYFDGLTAAEIGERLGVPAGTIKTRIRDGLLALRRQLGS